MKQSSLLIWHGAKQGEHGLKLPLLADWSASRILNDGCDFTKVLNFLYGSANPSRYSCAAGAYSFAISSGLPETRAARCQEQAG